MACLDTTAILDFVGCGSPDAQNRIDRQLDQLCAAGEELTTTRLNVAELWVGVFRSTDPAGELSRIEGVLMELRVLDFEQSAAELFGEIEAHLFNIGRPVGDMDALIAAVARANNQPLVTRNLIHFQNIPGLTVLTY